MDFIQEVSNELLRKPYKLFLEKVWTNKTNRTLFLAVIGLICLSLFFTYRISKQSYYINGWQHRKATKQASDELKNVKDLQKRLNVLSKVS